MTRPDGRKADELRPLKVRRKYTRPAPGSVLIQAGSKPGWWLRNDAGDVAIEGSVHFEAGEPKRTVQVVLRTQVPSDLGGKIRWKLAAVQP